jgi:thioredoxin 1
MPLELNEANFKKEVLESDKLTIVDFWAPWCGPCKMLSPIIDDIAKDFGDKIKVGKINTDENQALAKQFKISSIPCVIFFNAGKPVGQFVGFKTKDAIKKLINGIKK